jgi:hypothetical protein
MASRLHKMTVLDRDIMLLATFQVYGAPKVRWKQLLNRRLQNWGMLFSLVELAAGFKS